MNYLKSVAGAIGAALAMLSLNVQAQQVPIPQTAAEVPKAGQRLAKAKSLLHSHEGKEYLTCVDSRFLSSPLLVVTQSTSAKST